MHTMHKMYLRTYIKLDICLELLFLIPNKIKKAKMMIFTVMTLLADLRNVCEHRANSKNYSRLLFIPPKHADK